MGQTRAQTLSDRKGRVTATLDDGRRVRTNDVRSPLGGLSLQAWCRRDVGRERLRLETARSEPKFPLEHLSKADDAINAPDGRCWWSS